MNKKEYRRWRDLATLLYDLTWWDSDAGLESHFWVGYLDGIKWRRFGERVWNIEDHIERLEQAGRLRNEASRWRGKGYLAGSHGKSILEAQERLERLRSTCCECL